MAKTPLLNTLHGLFRDARTARARGWPLAKLRDLRAARFERDHAQGISRRAFLKGAGAITAATAVPRFSFAAAQPTVVIVGAGIAGLNCALELADLGIASTVLRSLGPHRRPHVQQHRLLERQPDHRVVRGNDRHGPHDSAEAGETLRPAARQPAGRPAPSVRRHLPLLRRLLCEEPRRPGFSRGVRPHCVRCRRCGLSDHVRLQHSGRTRVGSDERPRIHRAAHSRRPSLSARCVARCGVRHRVRRRFDGAVGPQSDFPSGLPASATLAVGLRRIRREVPHPGRQSAVARKDGRLPRWRQGAGWVSVSRA